MASSVPETLQQGSVFIENGFLVMDERSGMKDVHLETGRLRGSIIDVLARDSEGSLLLQFKNGRSVTVEGAFGKPSDVPVTGSMLASP